MKCPKCKGRVAVKDTVNVFWNEVYRQRKCLECGHVFYTAEFEVEPNAQFRKEWHLYHKKHKEVKSDKT